MKFLIIIFSIAVLLPITLADSLSIQSRKNIRSVDILTKKMKGTSEQDITVVNQGTCSQVLGYACSNTMNSGSFVDLPITACVNENGAGTITAGSQAYDIHENQEMKWYYLHQNV
jgi:hypothetical protein